MRTDTIDSFLETLAARVPAPGGGAYGLPKTTDEERAVRSRAIGTASKQVHT